MAAARAGRPDLGPVPPIRIVWLGALAVLRAAGLVLIAEAIARGIAGAVSGDVDAAAVVALGAAGALARAGAGWATQVAARRIAAEVKTDLRSRLWRRIAAGGSGGRSGRVSVLAGEGLDDLDDYYTQSLPSMIAAVALPLLVGLRVLGADWVSAAVVVVTVPLVPVFMILIGQHTQDRTDEATGALARLADHLAELARGLPVLVGLGRVERQTAALGALQRDYRTRTMQTLRVAFLSSLALELIAMLSVALVAVLLGLRLMNGTVGLDAALVALILAPEIFGALREVGTAFHASQAGVSALARAKELLARATGRDVRSVVPAAGGEGTTAPDGADRGTAPVIRMSGLTVRYAGRELPVVSGLDAELAGITTVTGPSGSGKSTVLSAIAGVLPEDAEVGGAIAMPAGAGGVAGSGAGAAVVAGAEGRLSVPGAGTAAAGSGGGLAVDPETQFAVAGAGTAAAGSGEGAPVAAGSDGGFVAGSDGRFAVGWAPQTPRAFAETPRAELALYGAADVDAALAEVGLAHVADASVAEISPGELRRLAVARALARVDAGARVLVLDEPTAHLDVAAADLVRAAIRRRADRAVVVLASHEPATLALASRRVPVAAAAGVLPAAPSSAATLARATQNTTTAIRPKSPAEAPETPGTPADCRTSAPGAAITPSSGAAARLSGAAGAAPTPAAPSSAAAPPRATQSTTTAIRPESPAEAPETPRTPADCRTSAPGAAATGRRRALAMLRDLIRPDAWRWAGAIALGFLATALGLSLTAVSGWLIVRASIEEYIAVLMVSIVGVRFFGLGRAVARYAERLATHSAAFRAIDGLRIRMWTSIASRGAGSRRLLEGGTPVDYLVTQADELRDQLPRTLPPIVSGALSIAAVTVTTWFVAPPLTAAVGITLTAAAVAGSALAIAAERRAGAAGVAERAAIVRGTAALADAADDLRANGREAAALEVVDAAGARLAAAERRSARGAGLGSAVAVAAASMLAAVVAPIAAAHGIAGENAAVVALLALASFEPVGAMIAAAQRMPALAAALARIAPIADPAPAALTGSGELDHQVGSLELDALAARYPGADRDVFRGLSGRARLGERLVVTGPSGSGKSTLLSVLMGALPAAGGEVRANGTALSSLSAHGWRTRVAWCPQQAHVFDSTLRGNLALARDAHDAPSDAEMLAVLRRAGLGELVAGLDDGLDARVGAAGSALSGGERQRLAVARALLTRSDVLLLDEPTAHLDAPTARALMDDVRAAASDRVTVLVTHRADDIRPDDQVVSLESRAPRKAPALV